MPHNTADRRRRQAIDADEEEDLSWATWRPLFFALGCFVLLTAALGYIAWSTSSAARGGGDCFYAVALTEWTSACDVDAASLDFVQRRSVRAVRGPSAACPDTTETRACTCDNCVRVNVSTATGRSQCVPDPVGGVILPCDHQRIEVLTQTHCTVVDALVGVTLGPACGSAYYENVTGPCDACSLDIFFADPPTPPPPSYPPGFEPPPPAPVCNYVPLVQNGLGPCYVNETTGGLVRGRPMVAPNQSTVDCPSYSDEIPCSCSTCDGIGSFGFIAGDCSYNPLSGQCIQQAGLFYWNTECDVSNPGGIRLVCSESLTPLNVSCSNGTSLFSAQCPAREPSPLYCTSDANCTAGTPCQVGTCSANNTCFYPAKNCTNVNPCLVGACNATSGACYTTPKNCNDNNLCTTDICSAGTCLHTTVGHFEFCYPNLRCNPLTGSWWDIPTLPRNCSDTDPCTTDACDAGAFACTHTPIGGCTGACATVGDCPAAESCFTNACVGSLCLATPISCVSGDPCFTAFCNTTLNACATTPLDCDDNDHCTDDSCSGGTCVHTPRCVDPDPCHISTCNVTDGTCTVVNKTCPLLAPCTTYRCNSTAGGACQVATFDTACAGVCATAADCGPPPSSCSYMECTTSGLCVENTVALSCAPDQCHTFQGLCNASTSPPTCLYAPLAAINDNDTCTNDSCLNGVISHAPFCPQNTSNYCLTPVCNATGGPSCSTTAVTCAPSPDACFTNVCQPATGACQLVPIDCDDGNGCTTDTCTGSGVCVHTPVVCNDGIACTDDVCNSTLGKCVSTANSSKCGSTPCYSNQCAISADGSSGGCWALTYEDSPCRAQGGYCNMENFQCVVPADCDDVNICTLDTVTTSGTCQHTSVCGPSTACRSRSCTPTPMVLMPSIMLPVCSTTTLADCCETDDDCGGATGRCDTVTHKCSLSVGTIVNTCGVNFTCAQPTAPGACYRNSCVVVNTTLTTKTYGCAAVAKEPSGCVSPNFSYDSGCYPSTCPLTESATGCAYFVRGTSVYSLFGSTGCCFQNSDCPAGKVCNAVLAAGQCV